MDSYATQKVRNVALVGHGGAGKTTLTEALLLCSGKVSRLGRVEDGTTTTDFDPEEIKRGISVSLSLAPIEWKDHKINLLDCPGYADFFGEVESAFSVADLAVFVVSAVEGVEVQTEFAWRRAAELGLPRMVFVSKLDRDRADFYRTLEQMRAVFGAGVAPLELPIGEESEFHGVADLLTDTAITYDGGSAQTGEIPPEMEELEHRIHDNLVEGIVVADDDLMTRYLDGDVPSPKELEDTLAKGVAAASVFPVICGSATKNVAIDRLADFLCEIGTSPLQRPPVEVDAGGTVQEIRPDDSQPPLLYVFKTVADPYVGKLTLFKVLTGTLHPDAVLTNSRERSDEKLHGLLTLCGKEQIPVTELRAGDIGAVAKLTHTVTGDTLAPKNIPVAVPRPESAPPALSVAIVPRSKGDDDKLMTALHKLCDEDPSLTIRRDDETHQTLLSGTGETHLAIVVERLTRKYGVVVDTEEVKVAYRETISSPADAEGKYKKQSGGHGQFGIANIRIEPLERGAGFQFEDAVVGGAVPRQFIPAVEKGVGEAMKGGGLRGHPVVDVKVTLHDGKFHPVDSSEMSFKMAGSLAFREAMAKASPVLLEPISLVEITVPADQQGDIMGDLNSRRGRVQGTDSIGGGEQLISALVPTAEILRYAVDLRSITGGRGRFRVSHDHYDLVPSHLADKVAPPKEAVAAH